MMLGNPRTHKSWAVLVVTSAALLFLGVFKRQL